MDHELTFMQRQRGLPSDKTLSAGLCNYPRNVVNIDSKGRVFVCLCEAWLPWSIGHVMDFDSLDEIWQQPITRDIQHSQDNGTYRYCDTATCGIASQARVLDDIQIYLGFDDSCQLACPSCRKEQIYERDYDHKLVWAERVISWIQQRPDPERINVLIGSHGDPFASKLYKKVMQKLAVLPVRFQLRTNGLLISQHLSELNILDRITELEISIDAGTAATYEQVRRPGKWSTLIDNLEYLKNLRRKQWFDVKANFVVQRANVNEMIDFFKLCIHYDMEPNYTLLQDWHTFDYRKEAVHLPSHPDHAKFVSTAGLPSIAPYIGDSFDRWTKS
jgi:MoaA/NifB/PqqE/SkfB family radical SAM enzyme